MPKLCCRWPASFVFAVCSIASAASAADLFVDNHQGDDAMSGRSPVILDATSGPVKSIGRALKNVRGGDVIHIANTGDPYYESLEVGGARFQGGFRIEGNGAVVSGVKEIPIDAWKYVGNGVWKFIPLRKAFYQLVNGDRALPEFVVDAGATRLPAIPEGSWAGWHGAIYFRGQPGRHGMPSDLALAFAAQEMGITFLDVDDVVIHDLEFRHFRLDGINVHDRCRNIILDHVKLTENGRAGLAVGGSSIVGIQDSEISGNRVAQVLNSEVAKTEIVSTRMAANQGVLIRKTGGHVLVEGEEARQ